MKHLILLLLLLPAASFGAEGGGEDAAVEDSKTGAAEGSGGPARLPGPAIPYLRNRASASLFLDVPQEGWRGSLDLRLSDRLRAGLFESAALRVEAGFDGRFALGLLTGQVGETRVREAAVHLRSERWQLDVGRVAVEGGSWRLVDGAQGLVSPVEGLWLGGWLGEVPDPWTTTPAPRFGGGPVLRFDHEIVQLRGAGEVAGGAAGLERAGGSVSARVEPDQHFEASVLADLEYGGPDWAFHAANLGARVRLDPRDDLRVDVRYEAWAGHAWLGGLARDPGISRFAARYDGELDPLVAEQVQDLTVRHAVGASLSGHPAVGTKGARLDLGLRGRYRHDPAAIHRYGAITGWFGGLGLAGGHLDLRAEGGALSWGGRWRGDLGLSLVLDPLPTGRLLMDASARVGFERRDDGTMIPLAYLDFFVDAVLGKGVSLSAGYRFTNDLDIDRWNASHAGLLKITWRAKVGPRGVGQGAPDRTADGRTP